MDLEKTRNHADSKSEEQIGVLIFYNLTKKACPRPSRRAKAEPQYPSGEDWYTTRSLSSM